MLDKHILKDPTELPTFIITEFFNLNSENTDYNQIVNFVYNRLAPDLLDFCKNTDINDIFIINNKNQEVDICKSLKYKCTGHSLYEKNSDQYVKLLDKLNKHLTNKKLKFNPSLYKDNPYFKEYVSDKMRPFL